MPMRNLLKMDLNTLEKFNNTYGGDLEFGDLQNIIRCRMSQNKFT